MFTPADLAKILQRKREEEFKKLEKEYKELYGIDDDFDEEDQKSIDAHYEFDLDCEHHCCCCCFALALGVHF